MIRVDSLESRNLHISVSHTLAIDNAPRRLTVNPFEIVLLIFGIGVLPGVAFGYFFGRQRTQTQHAEKMLEVTENAETRLLALQEDQRKALIPSSSARFDRLAISRCGHWPGEKSPPSAGSAKRGSPVARARNTMRCACQRSS